MMPATPRPSSIPQAAATSPNARCRVRSGMICRSRASSSASISAAVPTYRSETIFGRPPTRAISRKYQYVLPLIFFGYRLAINLGHTPEQPRGQAPNQHVTSRNASASASHWASDNHDHRKLKLAAHQHLAALTASPPGGRPAALTALREIYATAWRALRGLQAIAGQAPPIVRAVLDETRSPLPGPAGAGPGDDARSAAVGAALACVALDDSHPEHEILFDWILRADRTLLQHRRYAPGIGAIARRWAWSGPGMVSRVMGRIDSDYSLHARLRYTTATPRPRWPDLPAEVITRRAAMIPAMLWPAWTMRLLPNNPGRSPAGPGSAPGSATEGPRTGSFTSFQPDSATFLPHPGGPPQLKSRHAAPMHGTHHARTTSP